MERTRNSFSPKKQESHGVDRSIILNGHTDLHVFDTGLLLLKSTELKSLSLILVFIEVLSVLDSYSWMITRLVTVES